MEVIEGAPGDRQYVESYGPGRFTISGILHTGSVLVFPDRTEPWSVTDFTALAVDDLSRIMADAEIEFMLLGCGARIQFPPRALRDAARAAGKSIEPMDTGAACRTFNVLTLEERRVAAALIAL